MLRVAALAVVVLGFVVPGGSAAGQATANGFVLEDSTARPLAGVEVLLEGTSRRALTDPQGFYSLSGLATGAQVLVFRLAGYRSIRMRVTLGRADTTRADASLVRLSAEELRARPGRAPGSGETFEDRRKLGLGIFIESAELRQVEQQLRLIDLLRRHGVSILSFRECTGTGRQRRCGSPQSRAASSNRGGNDGTPCWMQVVVDGTVVTSTEGSPGVSAAPGVRSPDLGRGFDLTGIEAIEIYRKGSDVPPQFGGAGADCGVVVIWTRRA